jgi:ribosomal protein S18 acetylase RimI-like enzyme
VIAFRALADGDEARVIALWEICGLTRPWNDPQRDLAFARGKANSEVLVGIIDGAIATTVMAGHDGHRGWLYYLAVDPKMRGNGLGRETVSAAEEWLKAHGVWAINLMIRNDNIAARGFYEALGYTLGDVINMGKRGI